MAKVRNLQSLLDTLSENTVGETITVRDLLRAVGRRSYGPVLFLLGFVAISPLTIIPGASWLVALLVLIFSVQIVMGRQFPWLPKRALDYEFQRKYLVEGIKAARKHAHTIDRLVAPRLTFLTEPPFVQLVGLICIGAALVTFPLGFVPLGPMLPALTILLFGLGLTAHDGVVIALAGGALAASLLVLVRVTDRIMAIGLI